MLIKEAIEILKQMNLNDEVFLQFKKDNDVPIKKIDIPEPPKWPNYRFMKESDDRDLNDLNNI